MYWSIVWRAFHSFIEAKSLSSAKLDKRLNEVRCHRKLSLSKVMRSLYVSQTFAETFVKNIGCIGIAHVKAYYLIEAGHAAQACYGLDNNEGHCWLGVDGKALDGYDEFDHIRRIPARSALIPWFKAVAAIDCDQANEVAMYWDWVTDGDTVNQEVKNNAMLPMVATLPELKISESLREMSQQRLAATMYHQSLLEEEIKKIFAIFGDKNLNALLYKGWSLNRYYGSGERPFKDIDLIVWPEHILNVMEILKSQGYVESILHKGVLEKQGLAIDCHHKISDLTGPLDFDDHDSPFGVTWSQLFENNETLDNGIKTLGLTETFVMLCAHWVIRHGGERYLWAEDLRRVWLSIENHESIVELAQKWKLERVVELAYVLLQQYYGFKEFEHIAISKGTDRVYKSNPFPLKNKRSLSRLWWALFPELRWMLIKKIVWPSIEYRRHRYGNISLWHHWRELCCPSRKIVKVS